MDKKAKSPLPEKPGDAIQKTDKPLFTKGTIEPPTKK